MVDLKQNAINEITQKQKTLPLFGKINSFRANSGEWIDVYEFYTELDINNVTIKVRLKADSATSKQLLAGALGLELIER